MTTTHQALAPGRHTRVAYLVSQYPGLSHAFIEREIEALRAYGVRVDTHSVRPCPPQEVRSHAMRAEAGSTRTLRGTPPSQWSAQLSRLARRRPDVLATGLRRAAACGRPGLRTKTWQLFYLAEAALLYERMRADGVRHVHAHFANVGADVARLVAALGRAEDGPDAGWRWSFTMHGPTEFEDVATYDLPAKVRDADAVSCISDFCRSQLMRFVDPRHWDKLRVVRMSVDTATYRPTETSPPHGQPPRLLSVGRLVPEKGAPLLVDALELLAAQGLRVSTRIVGAGELAGPLRERIERAGLSDDLELTGPLGQDELPQVYRDSDVFVLPSFSEGLPVVLMEAMASGLPVVTTQIAAISELVEDGVNGRIVPPGRVDVLAAAIADTVSDATRARRWGAAGRARVVRDFTTAVTGPAMAAFLADVQADRPR